MPAVLLLPFVASSDAPTRRLLAIVLAGVAVGAAWELGRAIGLDATSNAWMCAFLLAGTDLLWCAMLGDVWFIAHVSAVCFTFLALAELAGKRRGWLVALVGGCAFESRFTLVLAASGLRVLAACEPDELRSGSDWRARVGASRRCSFRLPRCGSAYNLARWGTWYDIGYTDVVSPGPSRAAERIAVPTRSTCPMRLWSFFVQAPDRRADVSRIWKPSLSRRRADVDEPGAPARVLRAPSARAGWSRCGRRAARRGPELSVLRQRFRPIRHAPRARLRTVPDRAHDARRSRPLPAWGYVLVAYSALVGFWGSWYWNVYVRPLVASSIASRQRLPDREPAPRRRSHARVSGRMRIRR